MPNPSQAAAINFEALNAFTGNNAGFARELILAFLAELENFSKKIQLRPSEAEFLAFRQAHHSISPSLQMLGLGAFNEMIGYYKTSYQIDPESLPTQAAQMEKIVEELKQQIHQWLSEQK